MCVCVLFVLFCALRNLGDNIVGIKFGGVGLGRRNVGISRLELTSLGRARYRDAPLSHGRVAPTSAKSPGQPPRVSPHPPATRPFSSLRLLLTSGRCASILRGASILRVSGAHVLLLLRARPYPGCPPGDGGSRSVAPGGFPARLRGPLGLLPRLPLAPYSFPQTPHAALLPQRGNAPSRLHPETPPPRPAPEFGVCTLIGPRETRRARALAQRPPDSEGAGRQA